MLAGELALAGADVAILERRPGQDLAGSRAGGLHARTIEALDRRSMAERFFSQGQVAQVASLAGIALDVSDFPTRHNFGIALWQNHIEHILADWVDDLAVPIYRGPAVMGLRRTRPASTWSADHELGAVKCHLPGGRRRRPGWPPAVDRFAAQTQDGEGGSRTPGTCAPADMAALAVVRGRSCPLGVVRDRGRARGRSCPTCSGWPAAWSPTPGPADRPSAAPADTLSDASPATRRDQAATDLRQARDSPATARRHTARMELAVHRPAPALRTGAIVLQWLARLTGLVQIVLGGLFWTGNALQLLPAHMLDGLVFVLTLLLLAALGAGFGLGPRLAGVAVVWALIVPVFGITQTQLLPGELHWLVRLAHLLVGVGAMALAERLGRGIQGRPVSARRGLEPAG